MRNAVDELFADIIPLERSTDFAMMSPFCLTENTVFAAESTHTITAFASTRVPTPWSCNAIAEFLCFTNTGIVGPTPAPVASASITIALSTIASALKIEPYKNF
jgi:hypothetical protein